MNQKLGIPVKHQSNGVPRWVIKLFLHCLWWLNVEGWKLCLCGCLSGWTFLPGAQETGKTEIVGLTQLQKPRGKKQKVSTHGEGLRRSWTGDMGWNCFFLFFHGLGPVFASFRIWIACMRVCDRSKLQEWKQISRQDDFNQHPPWSFLLKDFKRIVSCGYFPSKWNTISYLLHKLSRHVFFSSGFRTRSNHGVRGKQLQRRSHGAVFGLFIFEVTDFPFPQLHYPHLFSIPIGSMYGIYANIGGILMVNVTIYSIHGSYGILKMLHLMLIRGHRLLVVTVAEPFFSLTCGVWCPISLE